MTKRRILVTSALPYANGPIHLGHLVEYIQTDIWVRSQKMNGHEIYYVCADDAHGTPIMLKAEQEGITPQQLVDKIGADHRRDFSHFHIEFDNYYSTHSDENRELAQSIYLTLRENDHICTKLVRQAFDPEKQMFLPDRYVKGICPNPKCGANDQYGDSCEVCGTTYNAVDLIEPRSVLSGKEPQWRESEHYFFQLADFEQMLKGWLRKSGNETHATVQSQIVNKLDEWFEQGLKDWDISRDAPYFGFEIPDAPNKYFYVWLDAPIGYMASFKNFCDSSGLAFETFWGRDSDVELYHFIGKDIAYFHTLFWPAVLEGAQLRLPTAVFCHGFLMVNGTKMSKSRGTFIEASTYLRYLNPEYLRYYFAAKLGNGIDDIDLNLEDFVTKVNADLVGKYINIASRCARIISKQFDNKLSAELHDDALQLQMVEVAAEILNCYEQRLYSKIVRIVMELAGAANQYIDHHKPWQLIKEAESHPLTHAVLSQGINCFRILTLYLKPILPELAKNAEQFLNIQPLTWDDVDKPLLDHSLNDFKPLMVRINEKQVKAMVDDTKQEADESNISSVTTANMSTQYQPLKEEVTIDDFAKLDLRVGRVLNAQLVEGSNKLLHLEVDLGFTRRQIFSGIRAAYEPQELVDKLVVVVANLKPRKMRFGVSEGMIIMAEPADSKDESAVWILSPEQGAKPGMPVT